MNPLHYLKNCIRGWLPKEPSFPNPQKTKMVQVTQKTKKPTQTRLALSFIFVFAVVFGTLSIFGVIGLGSYSPFVAGAVGALASAVSSVLLWKPRNQSSKPIEMKNRSMMERERKAVKIIGLANTIILCILLGIYFLINPNIKSAELTLGLWITLSLSLILVNTLLLRYYNRP
jgi:hypothetical protein